MTEIIREEFSDCPRCQNRQYEQCYRILIKESVDSRPILLHMHHGENFQSILHQLCKYYSESWKKNQSYYFYADLGGVYYAVDKPNWLRDKDTLIVTTIDNLEDIPRFSLNAVHASLKDDIKLQTHQVQGIKKMIHLEGAFGGGILADEMGLGKTLQTIALILRQQPLLLVRACTLVVVPSRGIADQWAEEIRRKTTYGSLPYFIYQEDSAILIEQPFFRVVLTTYDRVRAEYKRMGAHVVNGDAILEKAPLFEIDWLRVVLDESQKVREKSLLADSVNALQARFRWCLTGTPFQNKISELYPIFNFLKIKMDVKKKREDNYMMKLLQKHMIRRKKEAVQPELIISPSQEKRIVLEFTKPERALYDYLERLLYHQLRQMKENGVFLLTTPSFLLYLRLKQVCGHHMTVLDKFPNLIPMAQSDEKKDILSDFQRSSEIPRERNYYNEEVTEFEQVLEVIECYYDQFKEELQAPIELSELQKLRFTKSSTKINWLVTFLRDLLANSSDKIVVVSQFVDFIIKIGETFNKSHIRYQAYHGSMTVNARKCALNLFNNDPKTRVLVMSLKSGGIGLNLQRANHMVIMDRWWNPATMDQATARIHRMTQSKETFIYTVVIKDTIEESLMDNILNKKNALFQKIVEASEETSSDYEI